MENQQIVEMHKHYLTGKRLKDVANEFNLKSGTTVLYHFQRNNLETRKRGGAIKISQKGKENGNWKGGRVEGKNRHIRIWMPGHPNSDSTGYVMEHTLKVSNAIGRALKPGEVSII